MADKPIDWAEINRISACNRADLFGIARDIAVFSGVSPDYVKSYSLDIRHGEDGYSTLTFVVHCKGMQ